MSYLVLWYSELSKSLLWWISGFPGLCDSGTRKLPQTCNKPILTALNDLQSLNLSTWEWQRRYQGKCVRTECSLDLPLHETWWLIPIPILFPRSCPLRTAALVAFRHHQLGNLAGSSAGPNTGAYINSTTKEPPWQEAWNDLGVSNWACPTWHQCLPLPDPRASAILLVWGLCQQDEAFHCMTAECKALEGRQRQQKACSISENTADRKSIHQRKKR